MTHTQAHKQHRVGWLRAGVLGANDGIISISSLIVGVAAAGSSKDAIIISAIAGLVAGAISMAAGEYVSVCAQSDTEKSDLALESQSLENHYEGEIEELADIYKSRGVDPKTAKLVAQQMMEHDALAAHARDDIGISEQASAQPLMAAFSSAVSFLAGATLPILTVLIAPLHVLLLSMVATSLIALMALGACSAILSGTKARIGIVRVTFWGLLAMIATAVAGYGVDMFI